jgi:hypothetical protein
MDVILLIKLVSNVLKVNVILEPLFYNIKLYFPLRILKKIL